MNDNNIVLLRNGETLEIDSRSEVIMAEVGSDGQLIVNAWAYSKESAIEIAEALLRTVQEMDDDDFNPFEVN